MNAFSVEWIDEVDSTNSEILRRLQADPKLPCGTVVAARHQVAGRGRHQRTWLAQPGRSLCFSFYVSPDASCQDRPSLAMAVAMGVHDALASQWRIVTRLKWPNDILAGEAKLCGILAEGAGESGIVIGVGLNVNLTRRQLDGIGRPATSMRVESGCAFDIESVLATLLQYLPRRIEQWETGRFPGLRADWIAKSGGLGYSVCINDGQHARRGIVTGYGDSGELLLKTVDGRRLSVWSGELQRIFIE